MNASTIIKIEGIGPILFEKSKRARNLNISVTPSKPVRVSVPLGVSFDKAKGIVHARLSWIRKHSEKMKVLARGHNSKLIDVSHMSYAQKKRQLIKKVVESAKHRGFTYNKIFIRNQKTLWGSCSFRNNISLNIKLLQLPDKLINYIILHELLHTRIKNHSRNFWAELDKLVGDGKTLSSQVRLYHLGLME